MERKTNEQIQEEIEREMTEMSDEEKQALQEADAAMDRYMTAVLSRKFGATVETLPNDRHHIKINGVVMGYNEFAGWLMDKQAELDEAQEENSNEVDA